MCISLEKKGEMVVTWSTFNKTRETKVKYGRQRLNLRAKGNSKLFIDGGKKIHSQYIHRVIIFIFHMKPAIK